MKLKKIGALLLCLTMILTLLPLGGLTALAEESYTEGLITYNLYVDNDENKYATVYSCDTSATGEITIPATVNGYTVTQIGYNAFNSCTGITGVTLPDTITYIDSAAFYACENLLNIDIPENVTCIYNETFSGCSKLEKVTLPNGITSIESYAFYGCKNLETINLPESLTNINSAAFSNCEKLKDAVLPDSVVYVGQYAFEYCTQLSNVSLPDGLAHLGDWAFGSCENLKSIIVPEKIKTLNNGVFNYCINLESVTLPSGLTYIGDSVFSGCIKLKVIELPDKLSHIGSSAFSGCFALDNVVIPDGVTYIGEWAFNGCQSFTKVVMPNSVEHLGSHAFYECYNLKEVVIPDGITVLGDSLFFGCNSLEKITIPDSIVYIGNNCFGACYNLTNIEYLGSQEQWNEIVFGNNNENLAEKEIIFLGCSCGGMFGDWIVTVEPTCLQTGFEKSTCDKCGAEKTRVKEVLKHNSVEGVCTLCEKDVITVETEHNYTDDFDYTWVVPIEGAAAISIKFSADSITEEYCDYVHILDTNDNVLYSFSGSELSSKSVIVKGDTVKIRFVTDGSVTYYGFYAEVMGIDVFGDVDNDGEVKATDLSSLKKFILSGMYNVLADVDGDSSLTLIDLIRMKKISLDLFEWEDNTGSSDDSGDGGNGEVVVPQPPTIMNNTYRLFSSDDRKDDGDLFMCELSFLDNSLEFATLKKSVGDEDSSVTLIDYEGISYYVESASTMYFDSNISENFDTGFYDITLYDSENSENYIYLQELDSGDLQIVDISGFSNLFGTEIFGLYSSNNSGDTGTGGTDTGNTGTGGEGLLEPLEDNYRLLNIVGEDLFVTDISFANSDISFLTFGKEVDGEDYTGYEMLVYQGETYYEKAGSGDVITYNASDNLETGTTDIIVYYSGNENTYFCIQRLLDGNLEVTEVSGVDGIAVGDVFEIYQITESEGSGTGGEAENGDSSSVTTPVLSNVYRMFATDERVVENADLFCANLSLDSATINFMLLNKLTENSDGNSSSTNGDATATTVPTITYNGEQYTFGTPETYKITYISEINSSTGMLSVIVYLGESTETYFRMDYEDVNSFKVTESNFDNIIVGDIFTVV